jgi:hypothetical protein
VGGQLLACMVLARPLCCSHMHAGLN